MSQNEPDYDPDADPDMTNPRDLVDKDLSESDDPDADPDMTNPRDLTDT